MKHSWNMKRVLKMGMVGVLIMSWPMLAWAMQWPDTSQDKCYNNTQVIPCPTSDIADFHGQDAQFQSLAPSYTKLAADGSELPDSATSWVMVRDNITGLTWEVKTNQDELIDRSNPNDADNTYTWYDSTEEYVGNNSTHDTESFIAALNSTSFGGHTNWRLPTIKELSSILYLGLGPLVDWFYFPETKQNSVYWSFTRTLNPNKIDYRFYLSFATGTANVQFPSAPHYVRAVCDSH